MSNIMKFYLAQPWTYNPDESFGKAVEWVFQLRSKGFYVFSPILHTHSYWKELSNYGKEKYHNYLNKENWLTWDLEFMEGLMKGRREAIINSVHREFGFDTGITVLMDSSAIGKDFSMKKGWEFMIFLYLAVKRTMNNGLP